MLNPTGIKFNGTWNACIDLLVVQKIQKDVHLFAVATPKNSVIPLDVRHTCRTCTSAIGACFCATKTLHLFSCQPNPPKVYVTAHESQSSLGCRFPRLYSLGLLVLWVRGFLKLLTASLDHSNELFVVDRSKTKT